MVYYLEMTYGVGSRMVVFGVGDGGGYAPAWWNYMLWIISNNEFFSSWFCSFVIIVFL